MATNDPRMLVQTLETLTSQLDRSEIQSRETVQTAENMQRHMDEVALQIERLAFTFTEQAREDEQLSRQSQMQTEEAARQSSHVSANLDGTMLLANQVRDRAGDILGVCRTRLEAAVLVRDHALGVVKRAKEKCLVVRDMVTNADQKLKSTLRDLRACLAGKKATTDCSSARAAMQRAQQRYGEVKKLYRFATDNLAKAEAQLQEAEEKVAAAQTAVTNAEEAVIFAESAIAATKQGMICSAKAEEEGLHAAHCSTMLIDNAQQEIQHSNSVMRTSKIATDKSTEGMTSIQKAIDQQANASDISRLGREDLRQRMEHLETINRATEIHQ